MDYVNELWTLIGKLWSFLGGLKTPQITFFAIIISSLIAIITIKKNRKTAREKNALDFETYCQNDAEYKEQTRVLHRKVIKFMNGCDGKICKDKQKELSEKYINFSSASRGNPEFNYADPEHKENLEAFASIIFTLNVWERCANAVRHKVYDEDYIYSAQCSTLINVYDYLYPFVKRRREQENNNRIGINLEWLAVKWKLKHSLHGKEPKSLRKVTEIMNIAKRDLDDHKNVRQCHWKLRVSILKLYLYKKPKF